MIRYTYFISFIRPAIVIKFLIFIAATQNRDKVKANAVASCERLGRYRMPFAWTGIHLHSILHGAGNNEKDKNNERDSVLNEGAALLGANSLGIKLLLYVCDWLMFDF